MPMYLSTLAGGAKAFLRLSKRQQMSGTSRVSASLKGGFRVILEQKARPTA